MPIVITANDIKVNTWSVQVDERRVIVEYEILLDTGEIYRTGTAIFWETLPEPGVGIDGEPLSNPDNWYTLPAGHIDNLVSLTQAIRSGLAHLINE